MIIEAIIHIVAYIVGVLAFIGGSIVVWFIYDEFIKPRLERYKEKREWKYDRGEVVYLKLPIGNGEYKKIICRIRDHKYDRQLDKCVGYCGRVYTIEQIDNLEYNSSIVYTAYEEELISRIKWK